MQIASSRGFNNNNLIPKIPTASGSIDIHLNPAVCIPLDDFRWFSLKKCGHNQQITDPKSAPSDPGGSPTLKYRVRVKNGHWNNHGTHVESLSFSFFRIPNAFLVRFFSPEAAERERETGVMKCQPRPSTRGFKGFTGYWVAGAALFQADPNMHSWSEQIESRPHGAQGIFQRCKIH